MSEFQAVEDALGVVINGHVGSIPFVNTFGLIFTGTFDDTIGEGIGDFFSNLWADNLVGALVDEYSVSSIVVTDLREETGGQYVYLTTGTMTGESAAQALPFQTAAMITWSTAIRGRSYRGRSYFGGFPEDLSSGRALDAALITSLEGFVSDALATPGLGVISRFHGKDGDGKPIRREPGIITPITGGLVHPNWRTQRRRALASD
jgi:hypothetical protein